MADEGSRCHTCGCHVPTLWEYCESCRLALEMENRTEAYEELAWRYEVQHGEER